VFAPALGAYLCLLAGFHVGVQREFVRSWAAQGEFWKDVAEQCPDVKPGTIILYPLIGQASPMVRDQDWADYMVFRHVFAFPPSGNAPAAFGVGLGASAPVRGAYEGYDWHEIDRVGDKLYWKHWDGSRHELEQGNVILLRYQPDGRFERITGTVPVAGTELVLKPRGEPTFEYSPYKLFSLMFPKGLQPDAQRRVPRL
jgi:hypothetical protein